MKNIEEWASACIKAEKENAALRKRVEALRLALRTAENQCDDLVVKGKLCSGVVTIDADDFDAWYIRDCAHKALQADDEAGRLP